MQTDLDDSETVLPELSLPENQLCDIEISETDVEDVLSILNPCHSRSKALLMSQNTTLISFPLSKALAKSIGIFTN
jgi:hypothetical protein